MVVSCFDGQGLKIVALGAVLSSAVLVGCGDDGDADGGRKGGLGESCTKTDDCEAPLSCVDSTCSDGSTGGSGGAGGSSGSGGTIDLPDGGPAVFGDPLSECDGCLDTDCKNEVEACDAECVAVEACIETFCRNLGIIGSDDEGLCFQQCQNAHPAGKNPHLDLVNCSAAGMCIPPCVPYPQDYEGCRGEMASTVCSDLQMQCEADPDCQAFSSCVATCTSVEDCLGCDDSLVNGRLITEAFEHCIAEECIAESWLPDFPPI